MNTKIKLLTVALAVISCVVILSDSATSIQQIMGILIAILILHFYLTKHFDDVIDLSREMIQKKTEQFRIDQPEDTPTDSFADQNNQSSCFANEPAQSIPGATKLAGVVAAERNAQTDPYRLTLDQRPLLLAQKPLNCDNQALSAELIAPPGGHYEHVYDFKSLQQGLARKPANSIAAQ